MNTFSWVLIAVVALIVIVAIIVVIGLRRSKSKQISFEKKEELEQKKPDSGNYQAKGGFSFSSGGTQEAPTSGDSDAKTMDIGGVTVPKPLEPREAEKPKAKPEPEVKPEEKPAPAAEPEVQPEPKEKSAPEVKPAPEEKPKPEAKPEPVPEVEPEPEAKPETEIKPETKPEPEEDVAPAAEPETKPDTEPVVEPEPVAAPEPKVEQEPETEPEKTPEPVVEEPIEPAPKAAEVVDEPAPVAETETIAPVEGRIGRLRGRMAKSQNVIGRGVLGILSAGDLDEGAWEEIEDTLVMADLGATTAMKVVDKLRDRIAKHGVSSEEEARAMLREVLIEAGKPELDRSIKAMPYDGKPGVIMVVGVNGTGKTTTTGKLSRVLIGMGHHVVLGAADTFRAAAADQLETWGNRVGAHTVRGKEGADPAAVAFDSVSQGIEEGADVVLVDTAGRLHTSVGLMDQLGKVKRVVEKRAKVDEVLLVLDATVGQNGLMQARVFRDVVDITGVVLTKLDGTAKGGIVFQVQEELGVPVKLVGLGEGADDLAPFEVEGFVDALLG